MGIGKQQKITVIVKRVGKDPVVEQIDASLRGWQAVVGEDGYNMVQVIPASTVGLPADIDLIFNEEGKVWGMPLNFYLTYPNSGQAWDDVRGNAFFMARKGDRAIDLTPTHQQAVMAYLKEQAHAQ